MDKATHAEQADAVEAVWGELRRWAEFHDIDQPVFLGSMLAVVAFDVLLAQGPAYAAATLRALANNIEKGGDPRVVTLENVQPRGSA